MEEKLNKYLKVDSETTDAITGVSSNNARSVKPPKIVKKQFDGDLVRGRIHTHMATVNVNLTLVGGWV